MCGRYKYSLADMTRLLRYAGNQDADLERFDEMDRARTNHGPAMKAPVLLRREGETPKMEILRWGMSKGLSSAPRFNVRSETVRSALPFRLSLPRRRCLVPASAFYEWPKKLKPPQPFEFTLDPADNGGDGLMVMAGLWGQADVKGKGGVDAYCVLTTEANETVLEIHDRMPVLLAEEDWMVWLDPDTPMSRLETLWRPWKGRMAVRPVSNQINRVAYQGPVNEVRPRSPNLID